MSSSSSSLAAADHQRSYSSMIDVSRGRTLVFCFWLVLVFTLLRPFCAVLDEERWSTSTSTLPRRVQFLDLSTVASSVVVSSEATSMKSAFTKGSSSTTGGDDKDEGVLFEDEKRKIHTGPNPLHN
ncbi:hypothetical protein Sjap_024800 [Stephania japonica]|uniref:Uncharacterized protein n=1 Tax=Stephania japonica TaxID=461633 RepID=A0AAP0EJF1_9MAGN